MKKVLILLIASLALTYSKKHLRNTHRSCSECDRYMEDCGTDCHNSLQKIHSCIETKCANVAEDHLESCSQSCKSKVPLSH